MPRFFDEANTAANFTAIAVKDRILHELSRASSPMAYAQKSEYILEVLCLTDGLWNDLCYAYKAKEICDEIARVLRDHVTHIEQTTNHTAILNRLRTVLGSANNQSVAFFRLQSDKFCDAIGVTDPQTREIARTTNLELAS